MTLSRNERFFLQTSTIVLCLPYIAGDLTAGVCDEGWILRNETNTCYYMDKNNHTVTFNTSVQACTAKDSTLTSVLDAKEWSFIVNKLQACSSSCAENNDEYWIGLYKKGDSKSEVVGERRKNWHWLDKTNSSWENWTDGEPSRNEHCARLDKNGRWSGKECNHKFKYICKKEILPAPATTTGGSTVIQLYSESSDGSMTDSTTLPTAESVSNVGMYVGASVGAIAVGAIFVVLAVFLIRRKNRKNKHNEEKDERRKDPVYYNDLDKPHDEACDTGYHEIQTTISPKALEFYPGHASYAEVGQFEGAVEDNILYDTGQSASNKEGHKDLPLKEKSHKMSTPGAGVSKPSPVRKPSFLKRLGRKKPSMLKSNQDSEDPHSQSGARVNVKKKSRRSIRDLYAAVDFNKKKRTRQQANTTN